MHSFARRLTPSTVIRFVSLSASIMSAIDMQLLFQRLKPREALSPASLCHWIQHRENGRSGIYNDVLSEILLCSLRYSHRDAISTALVSRACRKRAVLTFCDDIDWKLDC